MRPLKKVEIKWSPEFAYAIGLITTDGSLSIDRRHINFTSKDLELAELFKQCLNLGNKIGKKARAQERPKKYFQVQFGDVNLYKFLLGIGLMPNKTKVLAGLSIPNKYFFDFLRGHFDGDGTFYSYWDPRWKSSFMFYTVFVSASLRHVQWLREKIHALLRVKGHMTQDGRKITYHLKYAKAESRKILSRMYRNRGLCLSRKRLKVEKALGIIGAYLI